MKTRTFAVKKMQQDAQITAGLKLSHTVLHETDFTT